MSLEQQRAVLDKTHKQLSAFVGDRHKIAGIVAPWWEVSKDGVELLLEYGIEYDHSAMAHDCQCYYLRDQGNFRSSAVSSSSLTLSQILGRPFGTTSPQRYYRFAYCVIAS
jgi:peptidoglycan/xylan/chitin deacetylase (PgdA/CDA1 family)